MQVSIRRHRVSRLTTTLDKSYDERLTREIAGGRSGEGDFERRLGSHFLISGFSFFSVCMQCRRVHRSARRRRREERR